MTQRPDSTKRPRCMSWLTAGLAAILLIAGLLGYLRLGAPPPRPKTPEPYSQYDPLPMRRAVSARRLGELQTRILAAGSRRVGQPGYQAVRQLVRDFFHSHNVEIFEQPYVVPVPDTTERQLLDADEQPATNVEIYPLLPNHFQPVVTPPEGLRGELILATDETINSRPSFENSIALIDAAEPPSSLGWNWAKYADLGFRAVIVSHRQGLGKLNWDRTEELVGNAPVNYVRLAASPGVFDYLGQRVLLRVQSRWKPVDASNLIGILPAKEAFRPTAEALVILSHYDAYSYLPDLAPGTIQAVGLASELALLEGLAAYEDSRRRDVIVVATGARMFGQAGTHQLLSALGVVGNPEIALEDHRKRIREHTSRLEELRRIKDVFNDAAFLRHVSSTTQALNELSRRDREVFEEQLGHVLNTLLWKMGEVLLSARLDMIRAGADGDSAELRRYLDEKRRYEIALGQTRSGLEEILSDENGQPSFAEANQLRTRMSNRLQELAAYHELELQRTRTELALARRFAAYDRVVVFEPGLCPRSTHPSRETVTLMMNAVSSLYFEAGGPFNNLLLRQVSKVENVGKEVSYQSMRKDHARYVIPKISGAPFGIPWWIGSGRRGFSLVHTDRSAEYRRMAWPVELPWMRDLNSLSASALLMGDVVLAMAHGAGSPAELDRQPRSVSSFGRVYIDGVGNSVLPTYSPADALVGCKGNAPFVANGITSMFLWTDPYGRYRLLRSAGLWVTTEEGYNPVAVTFGRNGVITHIKDEGPTAQRVYQSRDVRLDSSTPRHLVLFRAAPVSMLDRINPQTLKDYAAVQLIDREGLVPFDKICQFPEASDGVVLKFIRPDEFFYVLFRAGSEENELALQTRAFMLGTERLRDLSELREDREIDGPGYLAADHPILDHVPYRIASAMTWLNGKRLELQKKRHMVDDRTIAFHERAEEYLRESQETRLPAVEKTLAARDAVSYATLNHPVLLSNIQEAIISIVWYLCLLVPFAFFFEKLSFGHSDVRKQLATAGVVFLGAFALLRVLHPAFDLIESSLMVLLGFIIILISTGITLLFSGKFSENLEALRSRRGQVSAAQLSRLGVIGTAFMLGLNNMHKRRVRTALTCGTIVLITFAMICFLSVRSDLVDTEIALGKAPYQGMLIQNEHLARLTEGEVFAMETRFERDFDVSVRQVVVGGYDERSRRVEIPRITLARGDRQVRLQGLMGMEASEPLAGQVRMVTDTGWFPEQPARSERGGEIGYALLPVTTARKLGITPEAVQAGPIEVTLNDVMYRVHGLYDSQSLESVRDLDGQSILPFNAESIQNIQLDRSKPSRQILATSPYSLLPAEDIAIVSRVKELDFGTRNGRKLVLPTVVSIAVRLRRSDSQAPLPYKNARTLVDRFLEQSGRTTYYGLGGIAYKGRRARQRSLAGVVELFVPMLIAAMTVLNTMRGSVYERRNEIYVYNAVGIAPKYTFFMFFAEAFVYSVVGSVLGYFLAQGVGRVLTELDWTGGMNMSFTTSATIYVSLAIMAAVFVSTLFPALTAMRIAAPSEDAGWRVPEPEGDTLRIDLPFTFDQHDRIAVLEFFRRLFEDHGEGSSGAFFSSPPRLGVTDRSDDLAGGAYIPSLAATIWLKPFDLGVSQALEINLPTDSQTGEFIARLELRRLSGTRESWIRLNRRFLRRVRRHFLHWRAVDSMQRSSLFESAQAILRDTARKGRLLNNNSEFASKVSNG